MIWVSGCKGMLGAEISRLFEKENITYYGSDKEVNVSDIHSLNNYIKNKSIHWIINCAAYTAVDKAEEDSENCRLLNTLGAANLAVISKKINSRLIHISTDYVFDGKKNIPYREEDDTNPTGVYGLTKRNGELAVSKNNTDSYIIRTSWLYGKYGNNFVSTMIKLMNECNEIRVVNDQYGSPTWTYDLAVTILYIINNNNDIPYGIYNYSNEGKINWFDFACEIYAKGRELGILKKDCSVIPCSSSEYPSKVKRPLFSVLDKNKIKTTLGITIPFWKDSLHNYLKKCAS